MNSRLAIRLTVCSLLLVCGQAAPADTGAPSPPEGLAASVTSCKAVRLTWAAARDSGSAPLYGYKVYRNGIFLKWAVVPATSATDTAAAEATAYTYTVAALNNDGKLSAASAPATILTPWCSSGLPAPTGLTASATNCSTIMLRWNAPPDGQNYEIARYRVYRNGTLLKEVQEPATSTLDTGLGAGATRTYTVSAVDATGNESNQSAPASGTTPQCANKPPVADAGPDQLTQSLTTISFDGSGSSDPDGIITSYAWNFGDGGFASGASVSHTYSAAGSYTVTLTVLDNGGLTASDTATVQVTNRPPLADAGPDKTATAGMAVTLNGSGSSDPDGSIVSYAWDFGDEASASGSTVSHVYTQPGHYVVSLTVRDNKGEMDSDTAQVSVTEASAGGGEFRWARHFGNTGMDDGQAVATDSGGNVITTGQVVGTVDLGGGATCSASIFLAKYTAQGKHLWSRCFGGAGGGSGLAVAIDSNDNVVMTGYFTGTVDFGGSLLTSAGGADVFVAKYAPTGQLLWSKRFGSPVLAAFIKESGNSIAVDPNDEIVVTGIFEGTADFGGAPLASAGQIDLFVAKYSAEGQHRWSKRFGDRGSLDSGNAVAVDSSANVLVAGSFAGSVDFGGGRLAGAGSTIFIAKYSPAGNHFWSKSFGGSNSDSARGIAVTGSGDVLLTGTFEKTVNFGGGALTSAGQDDIFVAKYSHAGTHLWSQRFGSAGYDDAGKAVAADTSGNVIVAGSFVGTVDFGGGPLVSAGWMEIFVAKYTASGTHLWSQRFGARSLDEANAVTVSDSSVFVSGIMTGTVNFGGGPLRSAGRTDAFLLCLEP